MCRPKKSELLIVCSSCPGIDPWSLVPAPKTLTSTQLLSDLVSSWLFVPSPLAGYQERNNFNIEQLDQGIKRKLLHE